MILTMRKPARSRPFHTSKWNTIPKLTSPRLVRFKTRQIKNRCLCASLNISPEFWQHKKIKLSIWRNTLFNLKKSCSVARKCSKLKRSRMCAKSAIKILKKTCSRNKMRTWVQGLMLTTNVSCNTSKNQHSAKNSCRQSLSCNQQSL